MISLLPSIQRRCVERGTTQLLAPPGGSVLTAAEFFDRASGLCAELTAIGVVHGSRIGLALPLGAELLTTVVASWLAGASFVPIDPDDPVERRAAILRDSSVSVLLSSSQVNDLVGAVSIATVSQGRLKSINGDVQRLAPGLDWPDEAYVIFTSGSTGRPKGVSVSHRSIAAYIENACSAYEVPHEGWVVPSQLPATFDAALTTLLIPLITNNVGVPMVGPLSATKALAEFLRQVETPVLVKTTPSQLRIIDGMLTKSEIAHLMATIVVGGEPLDFADLSRLRGNPHISIINEYGPTETTVGCSYYRVRADDPGVGPVPIGQPFPGTTFTIDPVDSELPGGIMGELVVSGPGVALGYINVDAGSGFHGDSLRRYHTGDIIRRDQHGLYHFHGRRDDQVKVGGYRIELGEIEAALRRVVPGDAAAVLIDGAITAVVAEHPLLDLDAAMSGLKSRLPSYMQPATFVVHPNLPLTRHSKVDRRALVEQLRAGKAKIPHDLEVCVAERWRSILGIDVVASDTDFFAVGAHSITALIMVGQLAEDLGIDIPIALIFDHPTFETFVEALRSARGSVSLKAGNDLAPRDSSRKPAATQLDIIAAEGWATSPAQYTVVSAVRFVAPDWEDVRQALCETLDRHDVLQWRFGLDDTHQIVATSAQGADAAGVPVELIDLRDQTTESAASLVSIQLAAERAKHIDLLAGDSPANALLFRLPADSDDEAAHGVAAIVAHHAVVDETSLNILWSELIDRVSGCEAQHDMDVRFARWAVATQSPSSRERAMRAADHLVQLLGTGPLGALIEAGKASSATGGTLRFRVPEVLVRHADSAAARASLPLSTLYTSAAAATLASFMTLPRYSVFMPITRRRTPDDFTSVGCYISRVPVVVDRLAPTGSLGDWTMRWHRTVLEATANADADNEVLFRRMREMMPAWLNAPQVSIAVESPLIGLLHENHRWTPIDSPAGAPRHHLTIFVTLIPNGQVTVRIEWRTGTFDQEAAASLAKGMITTLSAICDELSPEHPPVPFNFSVEQPLAAFGDGGAPSPQTESGQGSRVSEDVARLAGAVLQRPVREDTSLFEAGAQSLDLVRLTMVLRKQYHIKIELVDLIDHSTPADIAVLLHERTVNKSNLKEST